MALLDKFKKGESSYNAFIGTPKAAINRGSNAIPVNDTFSKGKYQDYVVNTERATDVGGYQVKKG